MEKITTIIANISAATGILITVVLIFNNRKKIWRTKLSEKQFDYLFELYNNLNYIAIKSLNAHYWSNNIKSLNQNIDNFKKEQPKDYAELQKIQELYLKIKLDSQIGHNLLLPKELKNTRIKNYIDSIIRFEPFTVMSFSNMNRDELSVLQSETFKLMDEISKIIKEL